MIRWFQYMFSNKIVSHFILNAHKNTDIFVKRCKKLKFLRACRLIVNVKLIKNILWFWHFLHLFGLITIEDSSFYVCFFVYLKSTERSGLENLWSLKKVEKEGLLEGHKDLIATKLRRNGVSNIAHLFQRRTLR